MIAKIRRLWLQGLAICIAVEFSTNYLCPSVFICGRNNYTLSLPVEAEHKLGNYHA